MPKLKFVQCASFVFLTAVTSLAAQGEADAVSANPDTNVARNLPIKSLPPTVPVLPASNAPVASIAVLTPPLTNEVGKVPVKIIPPTVPYLPASNAPVASIAVLNPTLTNEVGKVPVKIIPATVPYLPASNAPVASIAVLTPTLTNEVGKVPVKIIPPTVPYLPASNAPVASIAVLTPPLTNVSRKDPIHLAPPTLPITPIAAVPAANLGGGPTLSPVLSATNLILTPVKSSAPYAKHAGLGGGQFQMQISGVAGQSIVLQASSDLIHWVSLSTNTLDSSPRSLVDTNAGSYSSRFYRAVALAIP